MFHESEECHIYRGLTSEMSTSLTFSFMILVHACLNSQVSDMHEKQGVVTLVQGSGRHNPDMQEKQGVKNLDARMRVSKPRYA